MKKSENGSFNRAKMSKQKYRCAILIVKTSDDAEKTYYFYKETVSNMNKEKLMNQGSE